MTKKMLLRAAKRFVKYELKGHVNCETIISYLRQSGYTITFYNEKEKNNIIAAYDLWEYSENINAFTVMNGMDKFVFIRSDLSEERKLYALLHELGHIILGHLSSDRLPQNERLDEIEAETFAYNVLHYQQSNHLHIICTILSVLIACSAIIFQYATQSTKAEQEHIDTQYDEVVETVAVTQHGTKFHREGCMSIKGKNYIFVPREEAEKLYKPCGICNP